MHDLIFAVVHGTMDGDNDIEEPIAYSWNRAEADAFAESKKPYPALEWYRVVAVPHLVHLPKET